MCAYLKVSSLRCQCNWICGAYFNRRRYYKCACHPARAAAQVTVVVKVHFTLFTRSPISISLEIPRRRRRRRRCLDLFFSLLIDWTQKEIKDEISSSTDSFPAWDKNQRKLATAAAVAKSGVCQVTISIEGDFLVFMQLQGWKHWHSKLFPLAWNSPVRGLSPNFCFFDGIVETSPEQEAHSELFFLSPLALCDEPGAERRRRREQEEKRFAQTNAGRRVCAFEVSTPHERWRRATLSIKSTLWNPLIASGNLRRRFNTAKVTRKTYNTDVV